MSYQVDLHHNRVCQCLSIYLSLCISIYLSYYHTIYLSIHPSIHSIYLSIFMWGTTHLKVLPLNREVLPFARWRYLLRCQERTNVRQDHCEELQAGRSHDWWGREMTGPYWNQLIGSQDESRFLQKLWVNRCLVRWSNGREKEDKYCIHYSHHAATS